MPLQGIHSSFIVGVSSTVQTCPKIVRKRAFLPCPSLQKWGLTFDDLLSCGMKRMTSFIIKARAEGGVSMAFRESQWWAFWAQGAFYGTFPYCLFTR